MAFSLRSAVKTIALLTLSLVVPLRLHAQPTTTRLTFGLGGVQTDKQSRQPRISADGSTVVYLSDATNLVPNDTNGRRDLFLTKIATGETQRINVTNAGDQTSGTLFGYAVSETGRYVVFSSNAPELGNTSSRANVFLRDTVANTTTLISANTSGGFGNGSSAFPTISADGRYVAFDSSASNLIASDLNGQRDIFVRDTQTATTIRVNVNNANLTANAASYNAVISGDGTAVAFYSEATNWNTDGINDSNGFGDVFVRNLTAGTTALVSVSTAGIQGNAPSGNLDIAISYDGKVIAFDSTASNLVDGDTNGVQDVFVRDLTVVGMLTTTRASVSTAGIQGNGNSYLDGLSADGTLVVYDSSASNLVLGDNNGVDDIFLRNRTRTSTNRISVASDGSEPNDASLYADISANGNSVVFTGFGSNLVPNDTNNAADIFIRTPLLPSATVSGTLNLQGIVPGAPNQTLTFTFRIGASQYVRTASVDPTGAYSISDLPRGAGTLLISGGSYLSKKVTFDSSAGDITLPGPILLKTGDATRDNAVDVGDLVLLITSYNSISPAAGYNAAVDFNLDGVDDLNDLLLLIANYNTLGDSF